MKFTKDYLGEGANKKFNGWWKIEPDSNTDGYIIVNANGGKQQFSPLVHTEIQEADDFQDKSLDWSELLVPDSDYGFIAPDGTWYGCRYLEHNDVAKYVLHEADEDALIDVLGYVKVYRTYLSPTNNIGYYARGFLTDAQKKVLRERGIELHRKDLEEWEL